MTILCAAVVLIGFTNPMSELDKQALETAKTKCVVHYPDAPCLTKFIKKQDLVYQAVCGKEKARK